jgi:alpha-ketoglutarate-dependent taurine dioxygenase
MCAVIASPQRIEGMAIHPLLAATIREHFVHVNGVGTDTLSFARSLGTVFCAREGDDPVVNMVIEGDDDAAIPYASCRTAQLSLHTDYATFPQPPRFTISHCIEPDPNWPEGGQSITVMMRPLLDALREERPELYRFLRETPVPFRRAREHERYHSKVETWPIIDAEGKVRFDRTLIEPILMEDGSPDAINAAEKVREFDDYCEQSPHRVSFALAKDEALIIDNHYVLHSRGPCAIRQEAGRTLRREVNLVFLN